MLNTDEHTELMKMFEKVFSGRKDKEPKASWPHGIIYQDGQVNELFLAYRHGYAYGKSVWREPGKVA